MIRVQDGENVELTASEEATVLAEREAAALEYEESTAAEVRHKRNRLLRDSDWIALNDVTLDGTALVLWQAYRQALRDVPQQEGFPLTVDWPVEPF